MKRINKLIIPVVLFSIFNYGCEDYTENFPVPPPQTVAKYEIKASNNLIPPDEITFYNKSIVPDRAGTATFYWDFDDGSSLETTDTSSIEHTFLTEGSYNVSLIALTSAGDSSYYSSRISLNEQLIGDTLFHEDFEGINLIPEDWVLINVDGNTPDNPSYANMEDSAWIVNYSSIFEGNVALGISFYAPEAAADDWMILPKVTLEESSVLAWDALSLTTSGSYPDSYQVYISTTTQDIDGCTANGILLRVNDEAAGEDVGGLGIQNHKVNLSQFAGQDVYVAFRLMTPNPGGDRLAIDNIVIIQP